MFFLFASLNSKFVMFINLKSNSIFSVFVVYNSLKAKMDQNKIISTISKDTPQRMSPIKKCLKAFCTGGVFGAVSAAVPFIMFHRELDVRGMMKFRLLARCSVIGCFGAGSYAAYDALRNHYFKE